MIAVDDESDPGYRRRSSKSKIEEKSFNISFLYGNLKANSTPRRRVSTEANLQMVPYKLVGKLVKVNPRFMTKEELMKVKLFPLRGWLISKNRTQTISVDLVHATIETSGGWRNISFLVLLLVLGIIITLFYFIIKSII